METTDRNLVSSAIHGGVPIKSYIKTILGKVYVSAWDSFENQPIGLILEGDPRKEAESSIVDVWTEEEDFFFRNRNKRSLQIGEIIAFARKTEEREKTIEEYSDAELTTVINSKFFSFQNTLNSATSLAVLFRIKNLASDLEKSEKIMKLIEARISEVQASEFIPIKNIVTEL